VVSAIIWDVDIPEIQAAFDDVFDQALIFHGFADYLRDYGLFVYATADPRTGIRRGICATAFATACRPK
jgi:hypothetical protein